MGKRDKRERNRLERIAQAEAREVRRQEKFRALVASQQCPQCTSRNASYINYGLPILDATMLSDLEAGLMVLGGCDISDDMPRWHCRACRHEWGPGAPLRPQS